MCLTLCCVQNWLQRVGVRTSVAMVQQPVTELTDAQRATLAEELGYTKIGKELPDDVTLTDIVKSMPPEVRVIRGAVLSPPPPIRRQQKLR